MLPAKALSIEEQINKKEFDGKIGFEQLQSFHGYTSNLTTLSDYKHKQYQYVKAMKLKEERRKERLKKEVEKACNPDQLVKFVTNFRIKGIQDNKIEASRNQANTRGKFLVERDDKYRPEQPDRWMAKSNFNTIFHRTSNLEMNIAKAKSQGNMMVGTREEDAMPYTDSRKSWVLRVPDQCNKFQNFLARVRVATDQKEDHDKYSNKGIYEHRDLAKNKIPFIAKFTLPTKEVPISRKVIPLLTATEAKIRKQPKYPEYPFGWYSNDMEGQMERWEDERHERGNMNYSSNNKRHQNYRQSGINYGPNTVGGMTNNSKVFDVARTNMNSRASMTSNVSHIHFSDLDLFDGRSTNMSTRNSFRTGTVGKSRGLGSIQTPGRSVGFSTM